MPDPDAHYRVVYVCRKSQDRIVSMTRQTLDKARSMVVMVNRHAKLGVFYVEDERDGVTVPTLPPVRADHVGGSMAA